MRDYLDRPETEPAGPTWKNLNGFQKDLYVDAKWVKGKNRLQLSKGSYSSRLMLHVEGHGPKGGWRCLTLELTAQESCALAEFFSQAASELVTSTLSNKP
jgi:hypothetical protein